MPNSCLLRERLRRGALPLSAVPVQLLSVKVKPASARVPTVGVIFSGDDGSGYAIGRSALRAITRAYDGRGSADHAHGSGAL